MLKKQNLIELLKTVVVVILLVALVCLCVVYMLSYQNMGQYGFTKDTMQMLGGESVKYQYADYFDASYVSPKLIGFSAKKLGENIGFYTLGGANADVYESILPFYEKLFSDAGRIFKLSPEEGEALFSSLLTGDYIYVVYENDLPRDLIYALSTEDVTVSVGDGEYIREVLLVPDRHLYNGVSLTPSGTQVFTAIHTFYAVARDSEGNYYRYTTDFVPSKPTDVSFNTNYYLTYTTTESYFSYALAGQSALDDYFLRYGFREKVTDTTVILQDSGGAVSQKTVSASRFFPNTGMTNGLLGALLMNPEKVTSFTDGAGVRFYYDEGRNLSVSPSGHLAYTAYGAGGLPLSELFEYPTASEAYDLSDYIGASLMLSRSLEAIAGTKDVYSLFLSGVYSDGKSVTVELGYAIDGMALYFDGFSDVLSLEFEDGTLKSVSYDLRTVPVLQDAQTNFDMLWDLRAVLIESNAKREYAYGYDFRADDTSSMATLIGRMP